VELRVLGTLRLTAPDRPDAGKLTHQARRAALLVYLATATPRGAHRRDKLHALFWPELDQDRARGALNQAVYVLRATLGEDAIVPRGNGALALADFVWCDAVAFEAALDAGKVAEALALYRGDLLDGFFISGAPEFERWLEGERERLRRRASEAAWAFAETRAAEGDAVEAEQWARRAADLIPADEAAVRRLMTFLRGLGDRAAAIRAYEAFVARLRQEYQLEPSRETEVLAASIRQEERGASNAFSSVRALVSKSGAPEPAAVRSVPTPGSAAGARSGRRRLLGWAAASLILLTAVALGVAMSLRGGESPRQPVVRFTLDLPAGLQMATGVAGSTLALSPDGSQLAYLAWEPEGTELFLRPLNRVEGIPIAHTRGASLPFFSPDGEWLGFVIGNTIRKVPLRGGPAITVCEVVGNVPGASWGPDDVIVFATPAGLWRVSASGGSPRVLALSDTARGERYRWPEVLPGGRAAVFTRVDQTGFQLAAVSFETGVVVLLGPEGTEPRFVASGYLLFAQPDGAWLAAPFDENALRITGAARPITDGIEAIAGALKLGVSPSGALAYAPQLARNRTLVLVDRSGRSDTLPLPSRGFNAPRFSPDGERIATHVISADRDLGDIWAFDLTAESFQRVTFDSGSVSAVWSVDGRRIAFGNKPGGRPAGWAIRWLSADGSDSAETLLPFAPGQPQHPADFAPDGRALVLQIRHPITRSDIWILPLQGDKKLVPYLRGPLEEHSPALSPNGRWLAYVSNESERYEVYVRAFPTPGAPVLMSSGGGREPRWAASGQELFYRGEEGMIAVPVTTSGSVRVGRRTILFDDEPYLAHAYGAAYDVHPDGRRFLMVRRGPEAPQVIVVLNLFDQLGASLARRSKSPD
jgi:DNA-binding SARP family transcriptional activator/Tol biopolymer transport system component